MASTPELRSQTKPQVKAKVSGKKVSIFDSDIGQEKDIQREDKIKAMGSLSITRTSSKRITSQN